MARRTLAVIDYFLDSPFRHVEKKKSWILTIPSEDQGLSQNQKKICCGCMESKTCFRVM